MKDEYQLESKTVEWLRFACIFLVVIIHTMSNTVILKPLLFCKLGVDINPKSLLTILLGEGLCKIAVPIFFLISGYYFFTGLQSWKAEVYTQKLKNRFHSLFIPYIVWNLIALIFCLLNESIPNDSFSVNSYISEHGWFRIFWDNNFIESSTFTNILGQSMHQSYPLNIPLWFLRDLMLVNIMSPIVYYANRYFAKPFLLLLSFLFIFGISFQSLAGFTTAAFFFSLGAFFRINGKCMLSEFRKHSVWLYILTIILYVASVLIYGGNPVIQRIIHNLFILSGMMSAFCLSSGLIERGRLNVNGYLANASFFIFLSHGILLYITAKHVEHLFSLIFEKYAVIYVLSMPFIITGICLIIYFVMDRWTPGTLSFLTGKRTQKRY